MNTRTTYPAVLLAVLLFGGLLSPLQAEEMSAPAFGRMNATLGCDKTEEGLKVTFVDPVLRNTLRAEHGIDIQVGDACLPPLAAFPLPFPKLLFYTHLTPSNGGATVKVPACIIWVIDGADPSLLGFGTFLVKPRVSHVLACDVDAEEGLVTRFVDQLVPDGTGYAGDRCGATLSTLTARGGKASRPIAAVLGHNVDGTQVGGLMWVLSGHNYLEVLECNENDQGNQLVVTYGENSITGVTGINELAEDKPCLEALAASEAAGHQITSGPIPVPQAGTGTIDPGCLVWEVDGGVILE